MVEIFFLERSQAHIYICWHTWIYCCSSSDMTKHETPLLLPPPTANTSDSESKSITRIEVDGGTVSLVDTLGPMVVNQDGVSHASSHARTHNNIHRKSISDSPFHCQTLSRIANWPDMTIQERERVIRVLGKRNK